MANDEHILANTHTHAHARTHARTHAQFCESVDAKALAFHAECLRRQAKLRRRQAELEEQLREGGESLKGFSLVQTVEHVLMLGRPESVALAEALRRDFAMGDIAFWHAKIKCHSSLRQWDELEKLARSAGRNRPPVGYEPFVEACHARGETERAARYAKMIKQPEERVEWQLELGRWHDAFETARPLTDANSKGRHLTAILEGCRTTKPELAQKVAHELSALGAASGGLY